jgi:hypothetical protein
MIYRNDIITKINERLSGALSDAALAAWAFNLFYAIDQGQEMIGDGETAAVADALDALMFADDTSFALDEADLRRLIARIEEL